MDFSSFNCDRMSDSDEDNIWIDIIQFTERNCDMHLFLNKMDTLRNHTCQDCLPRDQLAILIHILSSNFSNRTGIDREVISLINNLVPDEELEESQTDKIFCWLFSTATKAEKGAAHLIHWLILAVENGLIKAEYIQKNCYFSCLNLLKNENLVIPLSVLLKNVTHRNHCKTFIVKRVLNIMNEISNRTHKSYLSNLVREMLKHNQNFNHVKLLKPLSKDLQPPDSLRSNFDVVKSQLDLHSCQVETVEEQVLNGVEIVKGLPKITYNTSGGKRLFDIQNLKEMVNNWGRVIPPSVSLCSLSNNLGLTFIKFASADWRKKFHSEVEMVLDLIKNNINREDIDPQVFLERLALLQTTVQEGLPCVSKFFTDYLMVWDTIRYREPLINFIPWLYFDSIQEMKLTMKRLLNVFACSPDLSFKLDIIKGFGQLYSNMVVVHLRNSKSNNDKEIFGRQAWLKEDPLSFLKCLTKTVEVFLISALVCHNLSSSILLEAIYFYHMVSQIQMMEPDVNCFTIIPSIMMLTSIFSSYPVIEQLCSLMNWYGNVVVPRLREVESPNNYSNVLQTLELYTKELYTFLWNEKESIDFDDTMIGKIIGNEMIDYLKSLLGTDNPIQIHNHPAFATFFIEIKKTFDSHQPFTINGCIDILREIAPQCSVFLENYIKTQRTSVNNQEEK